MDDNKFWLCVWCIPATLITTLIVSISAYNTFEVYQRRMVLEHAAPGREQVTMCAYEGNSMGAACVLKATKE